MIQPIKSKLLKSIKSKRLNVFGLFILLAIIFLLLTKLSKTYSEEIQLQVNITNIPDEHVIVGDTSTTIAVIVKSHGFNLLPYYFYTNTFDIDFNKDVYKTKTEYIWTSTKNQHILNSMFGNSIEIISIEPDSLHFNYETRSVKTVPIKVDSKISYAFGFDALNEVVVKPDSVKVIGSEQIVSQINYISTEPILITDANSDIIQKVKLIKDENISGYSLSTEIVEITAKVEKFTEGSFKIPVIINNVPDSLNINFFPKTLSVSYYVSLSDYNTIKTSDFTIECNYKDVMNTEKTYFLATLKTKPKAVKSARIISNKVEFIISE
jgi:hypothetical protein